jgi:hypothetical protein
MMILYQRLIAIGLVSFSHRYFALAREFDENSGSFDLRKKRKIKKWFWKLRAIWQTITNLINFKG